MTIYKRHSATCKKVHAKEFQSLEPDQHRFFKKCQCAWSVDGIHPKTGVRIKQSLHVTSWDAATKALAELEGSTPSELAAKKVTIKEALEKWIAGKKDIGVGASTLDTAYAAIATCILGFAKDRGYLLISQFNAPVIFELIESPWWSKWGMSTRARQLANLRAFFQYALVREWIERNPALGVERPPSGSGKVTPFRPDEQDRLEEAFGNWTEKVQTRTGGQWSSKPTTLHCLKHVLDDTGLRISDALRIRPAIIEVLPSGDGECTIQQSKLDGLHGGDDSEVTVYLKPRTLEELKRVPWMSEKYPFMLEGDESNRDKFKRHLHYQGIAVYMAMQVVGRVAGVEDCRPHRFRHTFAVKMLLNGWELEKVSRFMGHASVAITQRFYAKWTKERNQKLRDEVISKREEERAIPQMRKKA